MSKQKKNPIDYCTDVRGKGLQNKGHLVCDCGSEHFYVFKRKDAVALEEQRASQRLHGDYWPFGPAIAKNKDGVTVVRKEFLWFKWDERPLSDYMPSVIGFQYVAAKCEKCGKEIVLFDGRAEEKSTIQYGEIGDVEWSKNASRLECVVDYDGDGGLGRLRVYKVADGKKKLFFDHET